MADLLGAFGIVFIAELGDKTQLVAAGFAARYRASTVAAGMCAGYVGTVSALIGVAAERVTRAVNVTAGLLFIVVGLVARDRLRRFLLPDLPAGRSGDAVAAGCVRSRSLHCRRHRCG